MSAEQVSIWKPTGLPPSGLWQGECNELNDVFLQLYERFRTQSQCSFEYLGWNPTDNMLTNYGSMKLNRIGKWLAYHGLILHEQTHVQKEGKKVLVHIFKPLPKGYKVFEEGAVFDFGRTFSDPTKIGVGKTYPSYGKTERWVNDSYVTNKVAQWRQEKWRSEHNNLYYQNLDKTAEEMHKILSKWLLEKLATIPARRGRTIKSVAAIEKQVCKSLDLFLKRKRSVKSAKD